MYVKQTKQKNGRISVAIMQAYWKDGNSRARTIKGFGYLDKLEEVHEDALAYVQSIRDKLNAEEKEQNAPVSIDINPVERIKRGEGEFKNIGCAIPLVHYNSLSIETTLRNQSRKHRTTSDPNAIMRLLIMERLLAPGSKLAAWSRRDSYFFRTEFSDDDIYRSLGFFARCKDSIISAMNKSIAKNYKRDLSNVFYDVTNYYFEIDENDEDEMVEDEEISQVIPGLRKRGKCKVNSKKPLVQMGLLQDRRAVPINFKIFPGNTHDSTTLLPVCKEVKADFGLERVIMVADKGLNSATNIAALIAEGNGFIFSQSIRGTKSTEDLKKWAISDTGWKEGWDKEEDLTYKLKSRQSYKTIKVKDVNGRIKNVKIEVKEISFWAAKYAHRAKHKRDEAIERAQKLIENPGKHTLATSWGAAKYVQNLTFDKKTGEVIEKAGKALFLDTERIAQEEKLDGYYCIITSETDMSDQEILDTYRGLWRIEEAFKITKSCLSSRPTFVWKPEHIQAHFLTCYIALTIIRLIQVDTNYEFSAQVIIDEIAQLNGVHLEGNWWRFYHRSKTSDVLCKSVGLDLSKKNMQLKDIKSIFSKSVPRDKLH
jgi:transposase